MDTLEFIAKLVQALAWPIATVTITILFRSDIQKILATLKRAKVAGSEFEFSETARRQLIEVTEERPAIAAEAVEHGTLATAYSILETAPNLAIISAWQELESVARQKYSETFSTPIDEDAPTGAPLAERAVPPSRLGDQLYSKGILDDEQIMIFHELRRLRNTAAHDPSLVVTDAKAKDYLILTELLIEHLQN